MKLELNTNGAWRTVLHGLAAGVDLDRAMAAAATLAELSTDAKGRGIKWRLTSEADGRVVEHCEGRGGWAVIREWRAPGDLAKEAA